MVGVVYTGEDYLADVIETVRSCFAGVTDTNEAWEEIKYSVII
jgi:hypothetical protein